jgi:HEPN domain-containing protein
MSARDEELAREWFEKAEHDLLTADIMLAAATVPTDIVCFHCQQAAEKYLKGFLTWHALAFAKTHDVGDLVVLCASVDPRLNSLQQLGNTLTDYAVDTRYPGMPHSDPTIQDARAASEAAREIRLAVRQSLGLSIT